MGKEVKIAYICNGLVPECSEKLGCFKCGKPGFNECCHTFDPEYAQNGICTNPENFPEKFHDISQVDNEITYWEGAFDYPDDN